MTPEPEATDIHTSAYALLTECQSAMADSPRTEKLADMLADLLDGFVDWCAPQNGVRLVRRVELDEMNERNKSLATENAKLRAVLRYASPTTYTDRYGYTLCVDCGADMGVEVPSHTPSCEYRLAMSAAFPAIEQKEGS